VGSVNTVTHEGGRLVGSTTDGPGALRAFGDAGVSLDGRRVLFTGSGGAVRAVAFAVAELAEPAHLTILGIDADERGRLAAHLAERTGVEVTEGDLEQGIAAAMAEHDVVVQGTPVGMHPKADDTCIPAKLFRPEQVVFDIVYSPLETRCLREAKAAGCTVIPGIEMFVNQAVLQFERWTGVDAPYDVMRRVCIERLGGQG
jgi:shikimate dehydrogenase